MARCRCRPGSENKIPGKEYERLPRSAVSSPSPSDVRGEIGLCRELILQGKGGSEEALERLFQLFSPLLENRSRIYGVRDEELGAEQSLAFLKCLLHFTVEELSYREEFTRWERGEDGVKRESGDR